MFVIFFFFQAEDGIRDAQESRGLGDVYKRQLMPYDIVYVPKSVIANIDKFVSEYINLSIPARFPAFSGFYNPYTYSFGGYTTDRGESGR